ncbi:hypothetical protein IEO21_00099 [Rhodonia placenta]|uniref:Uncharacterized protein n=1 Tax=Rhodonia placenta TaxID=104341 RepID=A0A8H7U7L1_9APHY|nr:hypothetical protein IEO21_00099 [Postia placenta]
MSIHDKDYLQDILDGMTLSQQARAIGQDDEEDATQVGLEEDNYCILRYNKKRDHDDEDYEPGSSPPDSSQPNSAQPDVSHAIEPPPYELGAYRTRSYSRLLSDVPTEPIADLEDDEDEDGTYIPSPTSSASEGSHTSTSDFETGVESASTFPGDKLNGKRLWLFSQLLREVDPARHMEVKELVRNLWHLSRKDATKMYNFWANPKPEGRYVQTRYRSCLFNKLGYVKRVAKEEWDEL